MVPLVICGVDLVDMVTDVPDDEAVMETGLGKTDENTDDDGPGMNPA